MIKVIDRLDKVKKLYGEDSMIFFWCQRIDIAYNRAKLNQEAMRLSEIVSNPHVEGSEPKMWRDAVGKLAALILVLMEK